MTDVAQYHLTEENDHDDFDDFDDFSAPRDDAVLDNFNIFNY